ncbi:hypothetical protein AB0L53_52545 [Nonomuraea sp. NPDC052129]|uniref:hypothetical protein n=1 Tax=Nonomuraea sp. NPDC052129 TaxID=3154651 RepID=UPI00341F3717
MTPIPAFGTKPGEPPPTRNASTRTRRTNADTPAHEHGKGQVRSADETTIGYRHRGHRPALILTHGGMQASQHLTRLATALSSDHTATCPTGADAG